MWGSVLPLGSGSRPSPSCTSDPTPPHKAPASTVPSPGAAPPWWPCGACGWGADGRWRPRGWAACLHGGARPARQAREDSGPSQLPLSPADELLWLLPRPPRLAARRARLRAAAARVPGHRRTCSPASLCPHYQRLIYWRIFSWWPSITQPHRLGCGPSRWVLPRGSPLGGQVAGEQGPVHGDIVPWLEGLEWASGQSLLVHLGAPSVPTS